MKIKAHIPILILTLCLWSTALSAQNFDMIRFSSLNPLASQYNPSLYTPYGGYVSFPLLSNLSVSVSNSSIRYNKLFDLDEFGEPTILNADRFLSYMSEKNNLLASTFSEEIIGFGFRIDKWFFSFSQKLKLDGQLNYSKDLFGLIIKGNKGYMGPDNPADIDLKMDGTLYHETAFGVHYKVNDQFSVGVRPKLISGIFDINVPDFRLQLYTDLDENNSLLLRYRSRVDIATPFPLVKEDTDGTLVFRDFSRSEFVSHLFNSGKLNPGLGIDLGGSYQINDQVQLSVFVNDIGFIKWRSETIRIKTKPFAEDNYTNAEEGYEFNELDQEMLQQLFTGDSLGSTHYMTFIDSCLKKLVTIEKIPHYYSSLTSQIGVEGTFQVAPSHRFIALFKGYIFNQRFLPTFTAAYNGTFWDMLDVIVSYSIMEKSYANLGIGVGLRFGPFHIYGATNSLFSAFRPIPLNSTLINNQFGMSFTWGYEKNN